MTNRLFVLAAIILIVIGCESRNESVRQLLMDFEQSHIIIPDDMTMICDGKIMPSQIKDSISSFVVYVAAEECSDCRIAHLWDYSGFFEWSKQSNRSQVLLIFSPLPEDMSYVLDRIISSGFIYPVFVDANQSFSNYNSIPHNSITHSFLLDKLGYPVLVGDPIGNNRLLKLYKKQLLN